MALLNQREAAAYLNVPLSRLRRLVREGSIPGVRFSPRIVRFEEERLALWLAHKRIGATIDAALADNATEPETGSKTL
jgi:excisionase family DNA binding protein